MDSGRPRAMMSRAPYSRGDGLDTVLTRAIGVGREAAEPACSPDRRLVSAG